MANCKLLVTICFVSLVNLITAQVENTTQVSGKNETNAKISTVIAGSVTVPSIKNSITIPNTTTTTTTIRPTTSSTSKPTTEPPKPTTEPPKPTTEPPKPSSSTPTPSTTSKPTPAPPTPSPNKHDRSFDVPSFIGGIILSLGLTAIGYVVYKFYKTRADPNYRSL